MHVKELDFYINFVHSFVLQTEDKETILVLHYPSVIT